MPYHYYQISEKETWRVTETTKQALEQMEKSGARRRSILSLNQPITDDTDETKIRYQGPFYIDIDCADVADAITSAQELLTRIESEKVPYEAIEIYCSGKKGFHFYFHPGLFSNGRPTAKLPYIYKRMAIHFHVPGLDHQVYSGGKGNLFRLPDVQREDGLYKVRILPDELKTLTADQYRGLTAAPRNVVFQKMQDPGIENSFMLNAFAAAKEMMKAEAKSLKDPGIADSNLSQFQNAPPECITDLVEYKVRGSLNFNKAAFQLAIYLARSATPISLADSLMSKMAASGQSNSYSGDRQRLAHVKGLYSYTKSNVRRTFSCSILRSTLVTSPCDNCPLHDPKKLEAETYEIEERPDGYYAVDAKTERRLTSFVLTPHRMITSYNQDMRQEHRIYTMCTVETNHEMVGTARIEEAAWNSRSAFVSSFNGMSNLKVIASDNDIQNLKHFVLRGVEDIDKQEIVRACGIHRDERYGKPRYTYVEEGSSANKWGQQNTHLLESVVTSDNSVMPHLKNTSLPDIASARPEMALRALIGMNTPEVVAPVLGWMAASHLKAHFMAIGQEFPLINLWGGRGSGKTKTSTLFNLLSGCDYTVSAPPALPNTTPFSITQTMMSTTTVPRVLDEFNKGEGMGAKYVKYAELFKQAFNGSTAMRGRIAQRGERTSSGLGAISDSFTLSAPLMILSEHATDIAALNDRMYKVMMMERSLHERRANMLEASKLKKQLIRIAKALTMKALEIRDEWVEDRMEEWYLLIPEEYSERQALTRVAIGTGLDYLELVTCKSLSMPLEQAILGLKEAFVYAIKDVSSPENQIGYSTEIDYLMSKLGELATLSKANLTSSPTSSTTFKIVGDNLVIDAPTIFSLLRIHTKATGERFPIPDAGQFQMLMRNETYFVNDTTMDTTMVTSRPVTTLSLTGMRGKGIDTSLFM